MDTGVMIVSGILIALTFLVVIAMIVGTGVEVGYRGIKRVSEITKEPIQKVKDGLFKPNTFCNAWTLVDFIGLYGPYVHLASHINKRTLEPFYTCEVSDEEGKTYSIRFTRSLRDIKPEELEKRKNGLFIGKTNNGRYYMYDKTFRDWESVDLNLT